MMYVVGRVLTLSIQATEIKYFDIDLMDHKGISHKLSEAVNDNKVVILSFTIYQADGSTPYNVALADAYSKYRDNGLEIYQVALDNDLTGLKRRLPLTCLLIM